MCYSIYNVCALGRSLVGYTEYGGFGGFEMSVRGVLDELFFSLR